MVGILLRMAIRLGATYAVFDAERRRVRAQAELEAPDSPAAERAQAEFHRPTASTEE